MPGGLKACAALSLGTGSHGLVCSAYEGHLAHWVYRKLIHTHLFAPAIVRSEVHLEDLCILRLFIPRQYPISLLAVGAFQMSLLPR